MSVRWVVFGLVGVATILGARLPAQVAPANPSGPTVPAAATAPHVPFGVGELLVYDAAFKLGPLSLLKGTGQMEIVAIEDVRGRPAYHIVFTVKGGLLTLKVDDRYDSWIDTVTLASLRYVQKIDEPKNHRENTYEIYPDRAVYTQNGGPEVKSVSDPLDDGSFVYFVRTVPMHVGQHLEFEKYFKPDKNPVLLDVLQTEQVSVPLGSFDALVVHPTIKASGIFGDQGDAKLWFTQDDRRIVLQLKAKMAIGSMSLVLRSYRPPNPRH